MMIPILFRNRSASPQLHSSTRAASRSSSQLLLSAVFAGIALTVCNADAADEPKSTTQPTAETPPVAVPEKVLPEKRTSSNPTVLKEASTPSKIIRYSNYLLNLYDANHDGVLQSSEWKTMHGKPELMDTNGDGEITVEEITRWVAGYGRRKQSGGVTSPESTHDAIPTTKPMTNETDAPPQSAAAPNGERQGERSKETKYYVSPKRLPAGLPEWFVQKDSDGDGQLTFTEYSPNNVAAELIEFESYDLNGDGVVTAKECVNKNSGTSRDNDSKSNSNGQSVTKQSRGKRKTKETP